VEGFWTLPGPVGCGVLAWTVVVEPEVEVDVEEA
jgi:hypothetical protein